MSDFEHDDELRDALLRAQPARHEAAPVLRANRARMARARARRRAVVGSITAASFALLSVAFFQASGSNDSKVIDVVGSPSTAGIAMNTRAGIAPATTIPTTLAPEPSTTVAPTSSTSSTTSPGPTTTTPTTSVGVSRKTVSGRGGTITVTWTTSIITVEQITDAVGWSHTVQDNGDDVEVEWRRSNPDDEAEIRLRLDEGQFREEIE